MSREWGIKEPQSTKGVCPICHEPFYWKGKGPTPKYCEEHRSKNVRRVKTGALTKTTRCTRCGNNFEQSARGRGKGRRHHCDDCVALKKDADLDRAKVFVIAKTLDGMHGSLFQIDLAMVTRSINEEDYPFELVDDYYQELGSIERDLVQNEVVWARSATETPHRQPFNLLRVDLLIEKKRDSRQTQEMIEAMRNGHTFPRPMGRPKLA